MDVSAIIWANVWLNVNDVNYIFLPIAFLHGPLDPSSPSTTKNPSRSPTSLTGTSKFYADYTLNACKQDCAPSDEIQSVVVSFWMLLVNTYLTLQQNAVQPGLDGSITIFINSKGYLLLY